MTLKVKQCCLGPSDSPRFEATVGDIVLVRQGIAIYKGSIVSILSSSSLVVSEDSTAPIQHNTISSSDIVALVLAD